MFDHVYAKYSKAQTINENHCYCFIFMLLL